MWGGNLPRPDRLDTCHYHRAHKHHRHRAGGGVEITDQALVAGEQARDIFRRHLVHREQLARDIAGGREAPGQRHMHPVVVPGER